MNYYFNTNLIGQFVSSAAVSSYFWQVNGGLDYTSPFYHLVGAECLCITFLLTQKLCINSAFL